MKAILPIAVTPAVLTSSTVPEADYAAWSGAATYAVGDRTIAAHRIFESAIAGNIGHDPTTGATQWFDVGPTNRWAMFDAAAGPATSLVGTIQVVIALDDAANAVGFVDLQAASVRVRITVGAGTLFDLTHVAPGTTDVFLGLPVATNRVATITITPGAGIAAIVGKLGIGTALDLGSTEDTPTITLVDYSKRETDDFGVTTVAERSWSRRYAVRSLLNSAVADNVQRQLAAQRAAPLLWIGDEAFPVLTTYGFYKDFSIDLTIGATSYCSLTYEGLPSATIAVPVVDPAITTPSNFLVLRPALVNDSVLTSSNVLENDHPEWSNVTNYAQGARVIKAATHRIYESLAADNLGNDPAAGVSHWLDVGPTNRWAMFDQALGTVTQRAGNITMTLTAPSTVKALAILDAAAASVRVQATGYDQTKSFPAVEGSNVTFLDLNVAGSGTITVTITATSGGALASVGTLLIGTLEPLGQTGDAPSVGITDFSKKNTDDFGNTTAVERAWSKRMTVKSLLATSAVDNVLRRLATLRATPTLWIADKQFDSLMIYGFFRDLSVQLSERSSTLGVTVEGLSKAAPPPDTAADILELEAKIAALASAGIISAGSRKRDLIIQWQALYEDAQALDAKYVDLGSPADLSTPIATMDAAITALDALLTSLDPPWDDDDFDTPIPDTAAWIDGWNDAYAAVAVARAGITGRPAIITLTSSADTFKYGAGGAPIGQTIAFHAQRQNTTLATVFTIYDSAGTQLLTGSATTIGASAYFDRVDDDTISMTSSQFDAFIAGQPERELFSVRATISGTAQFAQKSVAKQTDGAIGTNGYSNALVYLFKRAASAPAVPAATLTFTFATGALSGTLSGWTQTPPSGTDPLYVTAASASSISATDTIATGEWATPVIQAQDGGAGTNGLNAATVFLYQRGASAPAVPTATLTYTFASGVLAGGSLAGWTQTVPSGTDPIWVITATAISATTTDTVATGEWATPAVLAQNGASGANGYSQAQIRLYQRAASAPSVPGSTLTYTFATDGLTGSIGSWSRTPPAVDGNPLYVTVASAVANTATDTIATGEWSSPVVLSEDGATGPSGLNTATVFLYKRATSTPAVPASTLTYTFATSVLSGTLSGWTQSVPSGTDPIYVTTATAASTSATDTIATGEWAAPNILAQNGVDGSNGYSNALVYLFKRAASAPAVPAATLTYTFATDTLTGTLSGWTRTPPAADGNPLYVTVATASATGASDTIATGEWSSPVIQTLDGGAGTNGLNVATAFLYKRATSAPSVPASTLTFTFATGALSGTLSGWTQTLPSGTDPVYYTTATAVSTGSTDTIATGEWATPQILAQNGADGTSPYQFDLSKQAVDFQLTTAGVMKSGQLPNYILPALVRGTTDVVGSATFDFSISDSTNINVTYSGGFIQITKADVAGYIDVTPKISSVAVAAAKRIIITRTPDPTPPAGQNSGSRQETMAIQYADTSLGAQTSSVLAVAANGSGVIYFSYYFLYTGTNFVSSNPDSHMAASCKLQYRLSGAGSWSDATSESAGSEAIVPGNISGSDFAQGEWFGDGSVTGLTAGSAYEFRLIGRRNTTWSGTGTSKQVAGPLSMFISQTAP